VPGQKTPISSDQTSAELRTYVGVVRRRAVQIFAVTGIVVAAALFYALRQTPVYQSEAEVLVRPVAIVPMGDTSGATVNMEDEQRIATSSEVASLAAKRLGGPVFKEQISVAAASDGHTLTFTGAGPSAANAERVTRSFVDAYLEYRRRQVLNQLKTAAEPTRAALAQLEVERRALQSRLDRTSGQSSQLSLKSELDALLLEETRVEQLLSQFILPDGVDVGEILQPASRPSSPSSPDYMKIVGLAVFVGLSLGVGYAFVSEQLDERVGGRQDLELLTGAPVLAVLPRPDRRKRLVRWRPIVQRIVKSSRSNSPLIDTYKSLCWRVVTAASQHNLTNLMVVSPKRSQIRTAVTAELGASVAETGRNVLLVLTEVPNRTLDQYLPVEQLRSSEDGGLVKPELMPELGSPNGDGNHDLQYLWAHLWLMRENLCVLPLPSDFTQLGSEVIGKLLAMAREFAELVLIDAPSTLEMPESWMIASEVDGALLVVDGNTSKDAVRDAEHGLQQAGARVIGTVMLDNARRSRMRTS
jgi:succinoglycan biosynthesis transport protein ExoP